MFKIMCTERRNTAYEGWDSDIMYVQKCNIVWIVSNQLESVCSRFEYIMIRCFNATVHATIIVSKNMLVNTQNFAY